MASASEASVSRHTISTTTASGSSTIDSPLPHTPQSCSTFGPIPFHAPSVAQAERDGYGHQALGRLVANVQ
jgi:hypothetical protein